MKKIKLFKRSLMLLTCLALSSTVLIAQSTAKKPGIKNDGAQLKITKSEAEAKKQAELKTKCEANGIAHHSNAASKQNNAARPCATKVTTGPSPLKRSTFNALSPRAQEIIKSHPEKYTIID
jgi:hypothetical protein